MDEPAAKREPTAVRETIDVIRITVRGAGRSGSEWAIVTLTDQSGVVHITSSYGNWGYNWPRAHRGDIDLGAFLKRCDSDYLGNKLVTPYYVFDAEETRRRTRKRIMDLRREKRLTREEARHEWTLADLDSEYEWNEWVRVTGLDCTWDDSASHVNPVWTHFWEQLWEPHVKPLLVEPPPVAPATGA